MGTATPFGPLPPILGEASGTSRGSVLPTPSTALVILILVFHPYRPKADAAMQSSHRYLNRIRFLLRKLDDTLRQGDRRLVLTLLGVEHIGHWFPDEVPAVREADLVSLELPTTPVKAYLAEAAGEAGAGGNAGVHIRNIFWLDLLEHFRRHPPRFGTVGCNVNPHVRYLRARLYYRHGLVANDFEAPAVALPYPGARNYPREELGGEGFEPVALETLFAALPAQLRADFAANRIVHVGAAENSLGPGRHLVLYEEAPAPVLEIEAYAAERLAPLARDYRLAPSELPQFVQHQILEGFLLGVNDFYLLEVLLEKVIRAAREIAPGEELRVVHVAGIAHLPHLEAYLSAVACSRIQVRSLTDPRSPVHDAYLNPSYFARHLEEALAGLSVWKGEVQVDPSAARALLDRYLEEEPEDLRRRLLLKAIWAPDREVPEPPPFATLAEEIPLDPGPGYLERFASSLDQNILKFMVAEQPEPFLVELNRRLAEDRRRGNLATVTQELREMGIGYDAFLAHPVLGAYQRFREQLWTTTGSREEEHALLRQICRGSLHHRDTETPS